MNGSILKLTNKVLNFNSIQHKSAVRNFRGRKSEKFEKSQILPALSDLRRKNFERETKRSIRSGSRKIKLKNEESHLFGSKIQIKSFLRQKKNRGQSLSEKRTKLLSEVRRFRNNSRIHNSKRKNIRKIQHNLFITKQASLKIDSNGKSRKPVFSVKKVSKNFKIKTLKRLNEKTNENKRTTDKKKLNQSEKSSKNGNFMLFWRNLFMFVSSFRDIRIISCKNLDIDFSIQRKLGSGSSARVYLLRSRNDQRYFAAKIFKKKKFSSQKFVKSFKVNFFYLFKIVQRLKNFYKID